MSEAGFASLGPTLLARKGGAKPAMRPQLTPLAHSPEEMAALADEQLEDLGWNDMGDDGGEDAANEAASGADIVPIRSDSAADAAEAAARSPVVRRQQKQLLDRVLADAAMDGSEGELGEEEEDLSARYFDNDENDEPVAAEESAPAPAPRAATRKPAKRPAGKRAAFTLRLDTERHLKLRLAATMQGVSAQALVTEALDALLAEFEELDALAARMRRN
ncbi:toxin-antitoxin system HicB family antitoxin [Erythrobacter sp.]|uniref:toxin-antitoxin system HicB family antitoxin n=1 Tax=Erythrobacter sp. TaxID=1042 RepID=UPI001425F02C|nr:toxin-antitoxin system HicB family antitoxin [Erythrobacter sp.]QIQ86948.1 MAG: toxin-antitoxin system HicB family antitoxin [Erythrobacter sp.]